MKTVALPHAVLEDLQWLQRFAAVMARDADEADDLVQETLVRAWQDPPPDTDRPLRPWLGTVLRNRLRMRQRGERRRDAREQQAPALGSEARAPDAEHERLEVLRILLAELQRLSPRDQKIIVRRFFEGESAAEIGRALDIPSATIRSRIHRSLAQLRSSLDERFGSRQTWCAAVLAMPPTGSLAPVASNAGSSSTMSTMMKTLLITTLGGTTGVIGWMATKGEPEPEPSATPTTQTPRAAAVVEPTAREANDPRARWEGRRRDIRRSLPRADEGARAGAVPPAPTTAEPAHDDPHDDVIRSDFRELVSACMEDLGAQSTGAVTLSIHEIGAPGVGTIYESVEVVDASFDRPEVIECLTQSMYGYVGEAPAEPIDRYVTTTTPLGKPEPGPDKDAQTIGYIVGAHLGEVRFCESKAEGEVVGSVTVTITIGEGGRTDASVAKPSKLPAAVVECIENATKRWMYPAKLAGKSFDREFVLPVPGKPAGARAAAE